MTTGQSHPMKVLLVCSSDLLGGAAIVTWRLMNALRTEGIDARMLVYTRLSDSELVSDVSSRFMRGLKFVTERGLIMLNNGFDRDKLFKVSAANVGIDITNHPWVREADVINLNWINQGLLSIKGIARLAAMGKPLVWTMHDMWCMTGVCHHAFECDRFSKECGCCGQLNSSAQGDLSHRVWRRKMKLYDRCPVTFVAVSNWLAAKARSSSLLRRRRIKVIPNAFPIESFPTGPRPDFPTFDPIEGRRRLIFGAARIDDPIKGLPILIEALNIIFDNHPEIAKSTGIIFFGDIRNKSALDNLRFAYLNMGRVSDPKLLRQLYASSSVVVSSSLYETLPGTLIEGKAAGCYPVTFGRGGQSDIVTHLEDGYIARYKDPADLANGIIWALNQPERRQELHENVGRKFAADVVARRYIALYQSLLDSR